MIRVKKKLAVILFCLTAVIITQGCYKDDIDFQPHPPEGDIYQDFLSKVQTLEKVVVFPADQEKQIVTAHNTIITIPAFAFLKNGQTPVTNGDITFTYTELKNKSSLVLYQMSTVTDDDLLESAGVYRVGAKQGSNNLSLNNTKKIKIETPTENAIDGMEQFALRITGPEDLYIYWNPIGAGPGPGNNVTQSSWDYIIDGINVSGAGYEFDLSSFEWINCDAFSNIPIDDKTNICVNLPEGYNNSNTIVFALYKDFDSAVALYSVDDSRQFCDAFGVNPVGADITYLAITAYDEFTYYFAEMESTIARDKVESLVMKPATLEFILGRLSSY